ncbi:hypothetical protein [Staphylococcus hominis]|uniref:hypothetical protein n=1 Tax=Staphylococcus hominis TaxID=1290 RepID=UPI001F55DDDA|nr:hypothetical protein [Staphylococcus hominis]MCI2910942.1 hypothetical protein [Staphylococcus hominis]
MKVLKKAAVGLSIVGLTLSLGACSQDDSSQDDSSNGKGKTTTMAEILNDKQERKIVMTHDTNTYDSPDIEWAGTIGNGKMEIHPYKNLDKFEFNDIKNENMKDYKEILKEKDKEYSEKKGKTLNIKPEKATLYYKASNIEKPGSLIFDYNAQAYSKEEKFSMINRGFSVIVKDNPKNWLGIRTKDTSKKGWTQDYVYVEAKNNETSLKKDDLKSAMKKYNNVERIK